MLIVEQTKFRKFLPDLDYVYGLKEKTWYFCSFPYNGCALVTPSKDNGELTLKYYVEDEKYADFIKNRDSSKILERLLKYSESAKKDIFGDTFLFYIPKSLLIANLTSKEDVHPFYLTRPPLIKETQDWFVAVGVNDRDVIEFFRIKNTPKMLSMLSFKSLADSLIDNGLCNPFGADLTYYISNKILGTSTEKETHIRIYEHANPVVSLSSELPVNELLNIFTPKEEKVEKIEKESEILLSSLIKSGVVPDKVFADVEIDTQLSNKNITRAFIENGDLILLTKSLSDIQGSLERDVLREELSIQNLRLRFRG